MKILTRLQFTRIAIVVFSIPNFVACGDNKAIVSGSIPNVYKGGENSKTIPDMDILQTLEHADVAQDLQDALGKNDRRFIGYLGYSLNVPPIQSSTYELFHDTPAGRNKYGVRINNKIYEVRIIPGISDNILNNEHGRLIEIAIKYVTEYNRLLLANETSP